MAPYILAAEAEEDLHEIFDYTSKQWGAAQAQKYLAALHKCAEAMANGEARYKDMSYLIPGMKMMRCQHHYIFCQLRDCQPAAIYAVFHEQMDLMTRIAARLK